MSRWIVTQKKFSYKKRKRSFRKMMNRSWISIPDFKISQKIKSILSRWTIFIVVIILWIFIIIKLSFFRPEQTVSQVKFSEDTIATYNDIELFNLVSSLVKWKNYFMISRDKWTLLSKIQEKFPFVWDIKFQLETYTPVQEDENNIWLPSIPSELTTLMINQIRPSIIWTFPLSPSIKKEETGWTLWVEVTFYEPTVLVSLNSKQFAVRNEKSYVELKEWMLLWIRVPTEENDYQPLFVIETPQYLSWTNNLDWFFFELSLNNLMEIVSLAQNDFPDMKRFVYLVWSTRIAIFTSDDKVLYFNFPDGWDITQQRNTQITKYQTLKEKYADFNNIENINLWALEENKVIIKKY